MHSDWKNICTSAKTLITEQTNNSAVKIFSCLFLESKFSVFWPNSVGLISKIIQSIYPKFCTELAKGVNYISVLGIFFNLRGSGDILQKLPVIDAKQQFQLCNSIKKQQLKSDNALKCKSLERYCKPIFVHFDGV